MESKKYGIKSIDVVLIKGDKKLTIQADDVRVDKGVSQGLITIHSSMFYEGFDDFMTPDSIELHYNCKQFENGINFVKVDTYSNIDVRSGGITLEFNKREGYYQGIMKFYYIK